MKKLIEQALEFLIAWSCECGATEAQYLIFNALEALDLVRRDFYDDTGIWYLETVSPTLPISRLLPDGEVLPVEVDDE